jgi:hypothetical protein
LGFGLRLGKIRVWEEDWEFQGFDLMYFGFVLDNVNSVVKYRRGSHVV